MANDVDLYAELAAHMAPGGPAEFVQRFLADLWAERINDVKASLDPSFVWKKPSSKDLAFLRFEPNWGISGRPRVTDEGDEIVLYVRMEGIENGEVIVRKPTRLPAVEFVVRHTGDGWKMVKIVKHLPDRQR